MNQKRFKKIYIEITNICNLSCSFCEPDNRKKEYMSEEQYREIIQKIKPYTDYIYLHVKGEPLMHPKINEFIEIANQAEIKVNITTNGTLLDNLQNKKVRQINYSIQSSKDTAKIQETIQKLKKIASENNTYISLRLWREETNENKGILQILKEEFPEAEKIEDRKTVAKNIFLSIEEEFQWPSLENTNNADKINSKTEGEEGYCYGIINQIAILVDGSVVPCCLDHQGIINLGNIYQEEIEDILKKEKTIAMQEGFKNRKAIEKLCQKCQYKNKFQR